MHKVFLALLCITKFAQDTSQYYLYYRACIRHSRHYFILQSLRKKLPSTTLYCNAIQSTSRYYFVLESLCKTLPNIILCYKICTKYLPIFFYYNAYTKYSLALFCTTKLTQGISQYYCIEYLHKVLPGTFFVLQSLHKVLPKIILYYKICTKNFPVLQGLYKALPSTTQLVQNNSQYYFVLQSFQKIPPTHYHFVL